MRLDKKLLLIAPTIVLVLVAAGMLYAATELQVLAAVSDSLKTRTDFIAAVERGEKPLAQHQALDLLDYAFGVEAKRTAAIIAMRDLLIVLGAIGLVACGVLAVGVRAVPREHWPRVNLGQRSTS